ncbi:HlyD family efflux transporter periplasmic adaptor subunit [bacterium]|nr:HlyD family efflux transporter periplasmic adaptor subunit [bacterium]
MEIKKETSVAEFETPTETDRLNIRSDEVQEILSFIPHWMIRWGITTILIAILLLILASWIIQYPDVIQSKIVLTTQNPPVSVVARSSGKLTKLFVKENETVKKEAFLAAIENPANVDDALRLKKGLESFGHFLSESDLLQTTAWERNLALGELQYDYSGFFQKYSEFQSFKELNYYPRKIKSIQSQILVLEELNVRLTRQKEILVKDVELAEKNYVTGKALSTKGLLSDIEFTNYESALLQKKYALENAETGVINNHLQIAEYEKTILDLDQQYQENKRERLINLQESYKNLLSQLSSWEQKYILKAPVDGTVSFFKYWSDNQYVNMNDEVMTISSFSRDMVGKIYLSGMGTGKVKAGQKVKIKFDSYPYHEFGAVEGIVESVSQVSRDNSYLINVVLPYRLRTNYGKELEFTQNMSGSAEIVTEDLRLIERIFNQLKYVFVNNLN